MKHTNGGDFNDMIQDWSHTKFAKEYAPMAHYNISANIIANNCMDTISLIMTKFVSQNLIVPVTNTSYV
jgi:hypothetical protein